MNSIDKQQLIETLTTLVLAAHLATNHEDGDVLGAAHNEVDDAVWQAEEMLRNLQK